MNIVVLYKPEPHDGIELKMALRSIEKYLTGYDEIFVIGEQFPQWLKAKTILVQEDSKKNPRNIIIKLLKAAETMETFIRWDDDLYLTRPLDVKDFKYWHEGTLEQAIKRHHGSYRELIVNTAYKLTDSEKFYDVHTPMIVEAKYLKQQSEITWNGLTKTTYCHLAGVQGEEYKDCKINGPREGNREKIGQSLFFSTSPHAIDPEMIEIFNELYPENSIYE